MFARWDKMAKQFTRLAKDITIAVKSSGPNPDSNPALRRALQNCRAANMPKDKVETAVKRASGQLATEYEEAIYEGYAPHGVALIIETATDNPTRTVGTLRSAFNKFGGNLGASGSVSYGFAHMGVFHLDPAGVVADELELELIDHGLQEFGEGTSEKGARVLVVQGDFTDFGTLQGAIEARGLTPLLAESQWIPRNTVELPEAEAQEALALIDRLEQDDDVQRVFHNLV
jgi:YebC/PmpR family DNA-binding regulatory protein